MINLCDDDNSELRVEHRPKLFFEDKTSNQSNTVPEYISLADYSLTFSNEPQEETLALKQLDNSVIFVSEMNDPGETSKQVTKTKTVIKRMVVIDGNNVALHHKNQKKFSVEGLKICIDYFEQRGKHTLKVLVLSYFTFKCLF